MYRSFLSHIYHQRDIIHSMMMWKNPGLSGARARKRPPRMRQRPTVLGGCRRGYWLLLAADVLVHTATAAEATPCLPQENATGMCSANCALLDDMSWAADPDQNGKVQFVAMVVCTVLVLALFLYEQRHLLWPDGVARGKANDIVPRAASENDEADAAGESKAETENETEDSARANLRASRLEELSLVTLHFKLEEREEGGDEKYVESEYREYYKKVHIHEVRSRIGRLLLPITTVTSWFSALYLHLKTNQEDGMDKDYTTVLVFYFVSG